MRTVRAAACLLGLAAAACMPSGTPAAEPARSAAPSIRVSAPPKSDPTLTTGQGIDEREAPK